MISRRQLVAYSLQGLAVAKVLPLVSGLLTSKSDSMRCINIVNFLRGVEPRGPMDLFLPLRKQMEVIVAEKLPATWLLQYDALVSGPFVEYLKAHMPHDHEVGIWFEMNEMHCKAAGVNWRGRPNYEWDHLPPVAFTIGYTPEERIKLADTFMAEFKKVWGYTPKSVASWNLDSITLAHLTTHYGVDAYAVCRDQIATDGFTIWGAPIAGYYPSTKNCWSPALKSSDQVNTPIFRMLGQDPVYYYQGSFPLPNGRRGGAPITMEPVWISGRSEEFIHNFLEMISDEPTLSFAYAQLGQENNFGWPEMDGVYQLQMKALAELHRAGKVHAETMGESGRRFKKAFHQTPPQAQVMLTDSFGNTQKPERTIWYQSRFYRANLHLKNDLPFLRDITVYSDDNPQPYLNEPTRLNNVEQRMPPVLDGYHWAPHPGSNEPGSGGFFTLNGQRVRLAGNPKVTEDGHNLVAELPIEGGQTLHVRFEERGFSVSILPDKPDLVISFEWDPAKASLVQVEPRRVTYRWQGFTYYAGINGHANPSEKGWEARAARGVLRFELAQEA